MSLAILFHFLCTQHVSDINISIIRNLRLLLNYHIGRFVLSSLCVGDFVRLVLSSACVEYIRSEIKQQVTSSWSFIPQLSGYK